MRIEDNEPDTWRDLEAGVARILNEAGLHAEQGKSLETARGSVNVDVVASDDSINPPVLTIFECKHWKRPVPQMVIHSFRTIVIDSGANTGLIVSRHGFQSGAGDAARFSNIRLVDWGKLEELYMNRWVDNYMKKQISSILDPLFEYTEPVNSRIIRKASALSESKRREFWRLQHAYSTASMALGIMFMDNPLSATVMPAPFDLPLRETAWNRKEGEGEAFPDSILNAVSLRALMKAIIEYAEPIIKSFDDIFGERA